MHGFHRERSSLLSRVSAVLVPALTAIVIAVGFVPECFSSLPFHSAELHGHVSITKKLAEFLRHGRLFFFDHWCFTGWPVFSHAPPFPYLASAFFSYPLAFFSQEPARLSCQLLTGILLAGLPFSIFLAARGLLPRGEDGRERGSPFLLGVAASLFGTWFLAHPGSNFGLGAKSGTQLGHLPGLFSWHLLLLYAGLILRVGSPSTSERKPISPLLLSFAIAALLLTEPHSAAFALLFGGFLFLWRGFSFGIVFTHLLGLGISAFWWLPTAIADRPLSAAMPAGSPGDFFTLLLRLSPENAFRALLPQYAGSLSLVPVTMIACFASLLYPMVRRHRVLLTGLFLTVLSVFLLKSDFAAKLSPISLDPVKFLAPAVLLFITLLSAVPVMLARGSAPSAVLLALILIVVQLQEFLLWDSTLTATGLKNFSSEAKILDFLSETKSQTAGGSERLYIERPLEGSRKDYSFPYLVSQLGDETGLESASGLFPEQSPVGEFIETAAGGLGLNVFPSPVLRAAGETFTPEERIQQLRDFGVSKILRVRLAENAPLQITGMAPPAVSGPVEIFSIGPAAPAIAPPSKRLIGYRDLSGSLPFEVLERVFYTHHDLWKTFEIILLRQEDVVPADVEQVLFNSKDEQIFEAAKKLLVAEKRSSPLITRFINFPFVPESLSPETRPAAPRERFRDLCQRARDFFLDTGLPKTLLETPGTRPSSDEKLAAAASFDWESQRIHLSNLNVGRLIGVNYSYSTGWVSDEGTIFRGLGERMWFLPKFSEAELRYSVFRGSIALAGAVITAISVILTFLVARGRE